MKVESFIFLPALIIMQSNCPSMAIYFFMLVAELQFSHKHRQYQKDNGTVDIKSKIFKKLLCLIILHFSSLHNK